MQVIVHETKLKLGEAAADEAAELIVRALSERGEAVVILATGTSQFETLDALTASSGIDWSRVVMFHLDEYVGLGPDHPASFRRYLMQRFVSRVTALRAVNFIRGEASDPQSVCRRIGSIIAGYSVDVALVGIGENGHLAFNDPPADFNTDSPFIVVELDAVCRRQQLGEGWFDGLEEVPKRAISMSIRQIMKSRNIIASVPEKRKAQAVKAALEGVVTPDCPSSILQNHPHCSVHLDRQAASLLSASFNTELS
jgi:glucosamine-6-phosphate deaminase